MTDIPFCFLFAIVVLCSGTAFAGCENYTTEGTRFAEPLPAPRAEICYRGHCEQTTMDYECVNQRGSQVGYTSGWRIYVEVDDGSGLANTREGEGESVYIFRNNEEVLDLEHLTCRELDEHACRFRQSGIGLGAFALLPSTIRGLVAHMGIDGSRKFTRSMQQWLAMEITQLRAERATVDGKVDIDRFALELAKEWSSFATPEGRSYYDRDGIYQPSIPSAQVRIEAERLVSSGVTGRR